MARNMSFTLRRLDSDTQEAVARFWLVADSQVACDAFAKTYGGTWIVRNERGLEMHRSFDHHANRVRFSALPR